MLRLTVLLTLVVATFASTSDLQAQRRAPFRNMMRSLGHGWSSGYHWKTPGHDSSYYSPWSDANVWQGERQMMDADHAAPQAMPTQSAPLDEDNSAYHMLFPGTAAGQRQVIANPHFQPHRSSRNRTTNPPGDVERMNQYLNQHLKPYLPRTIEPAAVEIDHGGDFRITPDSNPGNQTGSQAHSPQNDIPFRRTTPRK